MTESSHPRIFITHSWRDIDFARRLYNDLKAQGLEVWFDDAALKAGHRLAEEINRGLEWCDVYIPIISREALASKWCDEEVNAAISLSVERGNAKPRIISALVEDCRDELKKRYPSLVARLYVDFTGRYEIAIIELLERGLGIFRAPTQTEFLRETWIRRFGKLLTGEKPRKRSIPKVQSVPESSIVEKDLDWLASDRARQEQTHARPNAKFFITHAHEDNEFACRIYGDLCANGLAGFLDLNSLGVGDDITEQVNRELEECDVYIPILSSAAFSSPWCKGEMNAATALSLETGKDSKPRNKPRLLPIIIENCRDQIPPLLRSKIYIDFTGRYDKAFQELLHQGFGVYASIRK